MVLVVIAGDGHRLHRLEEDDAEGRDPEIPDAEEQSELDRQHHERIRQRPAVLPIAQDSRAGRHPFISVMMEMMNPSGSTTAKSREPQGWSVGSCESFPPRSLMAAASWSTSWAVSQ